MVRASNHAHTLGWAIIALLIFVQPPGQIAADTKFNLTANPAGFLGLATQAYTDSFPLGQIQNQAYGYLFPQGLFFLLPLPDWILQRLWWTLLVGLAYSGMLALARRVGIPPGLPAVLCAVVYAGSPRILTTLTAISSEAWPVALVPWTLVLVLRYRTVAAGLVPVACMGAVNATATIAACLPAFIVLIVSRRFRDAAYWAAGCVLVSAWWIGPLLVLGRYSPPFTEFIESAAVTTTWLNPVEVLRGTTSWTPFVDAERLAGHLLVTEPVFILATSLIAALGLAGLARRDMVWRAEALALLALGVALLVGASHATALLDGPLAPLRNLHKFDPLVRLPLALGVGWLATQVRRPQLVAVGTVVVVALAPAWSLRLLPLGTWDEVSDDWVAAGAWLQEHAAGTRTLVVPAVPFARQEWGWTRDEPIQALTSTRFAFRDAIPLVDPEAIRGLDGQVAVVDEEALRAIGVGAVVVRDDLQGQPALPELGEPTVRFGQIAIHLIDAHRDMLVASGANGANSTVRIDGGGEVLPLLWRELGYFPATLTDEQPDIITDTPALSARNYGASTTGAQSAHLSSWDEDTDVTNRYKDYPSAGTRVAVAADAAVEASTSWADAGAFGGALAARSVTAAFDGLANTAWWPAPGDTNGWLAFDTAGPAITITATDDTTVLVNGDELSLVGGQARTVRASGAVRVELTEPVGISEIDAGIRRIVEVPGTAEHYFFQRRFPATDIIQRRFHVAAPATFTLSAPATIDGEAVEGEVTLAPGAHELVTDAETILLSAQPLTLPAWHNAPETLNATDHDRLLITTRAANDGLRGFLDGHPLQPVRVDAGTQAFHIPAGTAGTFSLRFAGDTPYRASLTSGAGISLITLAVCCWLPWRRRPQAHKPLRTSWLAGTAALAIAPLTGAAALLMTWAIRRYTLISAPWLTGATMTAMGLWLARAPWPSTSYAGDSWLTTAAGCVILAALAVPPARKTHN